MAESSVAARVENTGIYEIVNTVNGKRYVGSANDFHKRWKLHLFHLSKGTHHSPHLQASWDKHGAENFSFNKIVLCARSDLIMYEQLAMDALRPEFNVARLAGSCQGVKHSAETRAKLSAAKMGNKHTLGYKHRPESIALMAESKRGKPGPTKGKTLSPEHVAKVVAAHIGSRRSQETRDKIAAKARGRVRSPESIEKSAAALRGIPLSAERRAALLGNKHAAGRRQTDEERANRSEKVKAAWAAKKAAGIPWRPPREPAK